MPGEMELETLFVRIKADSSQLVDRALKRDFGALTEFIGLEMRDLESSLRITPRISTSEFRADLASIKNLYTRTIESMQAMSQVDINIGNVSTGASAANLAALQGMAGNASFLKFGLDMQRIGQALKSLTPLPNLITVANQIAQAYGILRPVAAIPGLDHFVTNITNAQTALNKFSQSPQLQNFSGNMTNAATAVANLNNQLVIYTNLMSRIAGMSAPGGAGVGGISFSGGGRGGGSGGLTPGSSFIGFDPIRRALGMMTSMATGMAVGFFGFQMLREVNEFDQQMNRSMSLIGVHMRQNGVELREGISMSGVRRTMEDDILNLSRRAATGPAELAGAFRELSAAGYGTAASMQALSVVEQFAFVHTMQAASAAQHLTTIQRQLGLTSNDLATNTTNFTRIADLITSGSLISGMSAENFVRGIQRVTPHIRFMNRGLEDSVALMTAFGRIDATSASARVEALVRGLDTEFIRSITSPAQLRSGGQAGRDPIGPHARRFQPGMGVDPVHRLFDNVRLPSQAFGNLGVTRAMANDVTAVIRQIDIATRNMEPQMRLQRIMALSLPHAAQEALLSLLSSSEGMQAFYLSARRVDGVLDQVANERLQTFSAQLAILKNNVVVIGVEIGRVLAPVLREMNSLLISSLDAWWEMGGAGRHATIVVAGLVIGLAVLRFAVPVTLGLLRLLFVDTIVTGAIMAKDAVMIFVRSIEFMANVALAMGAAIRTGFVWIGTMVGLLYNMVQASSLFLSMASGVAAFFKGLWLAAMAIATGVMAAFGIATSFTTINIIGLTIAQVAAKVATWLLSIAMTGLALVLVTVIALTGILLVVMLAIVAVFVLLGVALIVDLALLIILAAIILTLFSVNLNWRRGWDSFREGVRDAFWATVGFLDNFQENMDRIMTWMDVNWPLVVLNIGHTIDTVFNNIWENMKTGFASALVFMIDRINGFINTLNNAIQGPGGRLLFAVLFPGAAIVGAGVPRIPELIPEARRQLGEIAGRPRLGLREGEVHQELGGLELRWDVSEQTRQMIDNMFGRPRDAGHADVNDAANRIGQTFKEISLKRFVLEGSTTDEDRQRQELILMQRQVDLLEILVGQALGVQIGVASGGLPQIVP